MKIPEEGKEERGKGNRWKEQEKHTLCEKFMVTVL